MTQIQEEAKKKKLRRRDEISKILAGCKKKKRQSADWLRGKKQKRNRNGGNPDRSGLRFVQQLEHGAR